MMALPGRSDGLLANEPRSILIKDVLQEPRFAAQLFRGGGQRVTQHTDVISVDNFVRGEHDFVV